MISEVSISSVQIAKPLLGLFHTNFVDFAKPKRQESRRRVSDNMLDGKGWPELILPISGGNTKACSHGEGNVQPCQG